MNYITNYIKYLRDNPEQYWFKRKLYGWGWVPARWQGWVTLAVFIIFFIVNGLTLGEAPADAEVKLFSIRLALGVFVLIYICYKTGESPRWQWGIDKDKNTH